MVGIGSKLSKSCFLVLKWILPHKLCSYVMQYPICNIQYQWLSYSAARKLCTQILSEHEYNSRTCTVYMRESLVISANMPEGQNIRNVRSSIVRDRLHASNGSEEKQGFKPMDGRFLQGQDQSSKRQAHPPWCLRHYSRCICNGAFELNEISRRSERLAGVVSTAAGEAKKESKREHNRHCRKWFREDVRKRRELGNEDEEGWDKRREG